MENQEKMMRLEESKGLVKNLKSYFENPDDLVGKSNVDYRLNFSQLINNINQGISLEDIGITQDELDKFEKHSSTFI